MRIFALIYVCMSFVYADYRQKLEDGLNDNEKIKQLEYEIKALEQEARSKAKWDNPSLNLVYGNANITQPFDFGVSDMQNLGIGISQNFDLNGKRALDSDITKLKMQIKIFELKNLKNQYQLILLRHMIALNKNKKIMQFVKDSIANIDTLLGSLQKSNNANLMQIQKLQLLRAKLQMRKNEVESELENSHIVMSEVSFGHFLGDFFDDFSLLRDAVILQDAKLMDEIMQNNYEIAIANLQDQIGLNTLRAAKKSMMPDLKINLNYMIRKYRTDMFSFGVSIPMPVWGKELAQIKQAQYNQDAKKSQLLEIENKIKHEVMALKNKIKTLQGNIDVIDTTLLPANKKIIELYKHHSTSQSNAFLEFYVALNEQIDAEILRLQTISDIAIAYYTLRSLRGQI